MTNRDALQAETRLQWLVREVRRPVQVRETETYQEIGVRSHGRGVFHKEPTTGALIGNKRVFWLEPGCLVFNIVFAWEGAVATVSEAERGMIASHRFPTYRAVPGRSDVRFLQYFFASPLGLSLLREHSPGAAGRNKTLSQTRLLKEKLRLPVGRKQRAIADFLDRKTTAIDDLIAKKRTLIELLEEKRAALTNQAVTKGLDPNLPMKDSGIDWIGEIPAHWELIRVRWLTRILRGKFSHRPRNDPRFYGGDYPFVQTGQVANAERYVETYTQTLNELGYGVSKEFPAGTLLMVITGAKTGHVAILGFDACFPDSVVGFVPDERRIGRDFLYALFRAMESRLLEVAVVSTQENLNVERIGDLKVPCPPLGEQQSIVEHLDRYVSSAVSARRLLERQIGLLHEYRQSLITAAVTGQLDIEAAEGEAA